MATSMLHCSGEGIAFRHLTFLRPTVETGSRGNRQAKGETRSVMEIVIVTSDENKELNGGIK